MGRIEKRLLDRLYSHRGYTYLSILLLLVFGASALSGCSRPQAAMAPKKEDQTVPKEQKDGAQPNTKAKQRRFEFHYRFAVNDLPSGEQVRVWLPVPSSTEYQTIKPLTPNLPAEPAFHQDAKYGNKILFFDAKVDSGGTVMVDVPYEVVRREFIAATAAKSASLDKVQQELFLGENRKVPTSGKPTELLDGHQLSSDKWELANQLYNIVDQHVSYNKEGEGWGNGDVLWVCDSQKGNCTDFHSLFISLARSTGIPARFEIGFPLPTDAKMGRIGGYHCWAFFHEPSRGWIPVDISEADKHPEMKEYYFGNLTPDRLTFSTGRDIELVPQTSSSEPLNYFVYPHVEVNNEVVPRKQIDLQFSFRDL